MLRRFIPFAAIALMVTFTSPLYSQKSKAQEKTEKSD